MAELTTLDEKLAEVIGLAMAAQGATAKVKGMLGDGELAAQLDEMNRQASEAEQRATEVGSKEIRELVRWQLPIQKQHLKNAQAGLVTLAAQEDPDGTS